MPSSSPPRLPDQVAWSRMGNTRPPRWLIACDHVFVVMPLVTINILMLLAVRASTHLGRWPQPWIDDPKFIAPHDPLLLFLYGLVLPGVFGSVVGLILVPLLTLLLRRAYPYHWHGVRLLVFGIAFLLLYSDPWRLLTWFID